MGMTDVGEARSIQAFAVIESTFGDIEIPSAADAVFVLDTPTLSNAREELADEEKREGASEINHFLGRYNPTDWSFQTYIKPSGSAGTAPQHDALFECALGAKATVGGTSVTYSLAETLSSFTFWYLFDHTLFIVPGCTVNQLEIMTNGSEYHKANWSGQGLQRYFAGTATLASDCTSGTTAVVGTGEGDRFSANGYIQIGADNNGGAGYKITGVVSDTITFTPTLAGSGAASGGTVAPFVPSSMTSVGSPVLGKLGAATRDSSTMEILDSTITLTNNIKYYNDEKNNSLYPSEMGRPGRREVMVSASMYFYKKYATWFANQRDSDTVEMVIPAGSTAGSIVTHYLPASGGQGVIINNPDISGDEEGVIAIEGKSIASSTLNDEFSIVFT